MFKAVSPERYIYFSFMLFAYRLVRIQSGWIVLFYHVHEIGVKSGVIKRVKTLRQKERLFNYRVIIFVV